MPDDSPKRRVYVVDDEWVIASTLAAILNFSGFQAVGFMNPEQALQSAELEPPELLISDVVMPEMNGIELAIRLRSTCPNLKVLLFSGQASTDGLLDIAAKQGHDFKILGKPVHPKDLLATIATL